MDKKLPKTVTQTYYAHLPKYEWEEGMDLWRHDMSEHGYVCLGPVTITFDVPQIDVVAAQIGTLEKVKAEVVQEYEAKLRQIDENIQNLRALSYDGDRLLREEDAAREQADRLDQAAEMQG